MTLALAAALLVACGSSDSGGGESDEQLSVVATTSIAADIVRQVGGESVDVVQLVPDGASPHSHAPSAQDQKALVDSDVLVYFHSALEEQIAIEDAGRTFAIADHVGELRTIKEGEAVQDHGHEDEHGQGEHGEEEHEEGGEHAHEAGTTDPHVWLDPLAVAAAVPALADELAALDPANAAAYEQRAEEYVDELEGLDRELREMTAEVPEDTRKLVTSHDALGYLADRYGFEVVGAPFGFSPEAEASAKEVAELIETVEHEQVPTVFAQVGDNSQIVETVAEEAGVEVVTDLLVETLGEQADSYVEMMRYTTGRIADGLGG